MQACFMLNILKNSCPALYNVFLRVSHMSCTHSHPLSTSHTNWGVDATIEEMLLTVKIVQLPEPIYENGYSLSSQNDIYSMCLTLAIP